MISVSGKKWVEKKINKNKSDKIKQDYNFSEILSKLAVSRNFDEVELYSIKKPLNLKNMFLKNIDFKTGINLVLSSIKKKEKICILGDYDVDGSCSTALLVRFFESIDHPYFFYIPDRLIDGYGASTKLFKKLIKKRPKLIIMVDCGSTANSAIDYLNKINVKSLVIDHHEINKPFPKSNTIINPKKDIGYVEYDYLCATALTYFFIEILIKKTKSNMLVENFLIYVLLATVCDVMPLRKLNRLISIKTLNEFKITENLAFNEIYQLCNKKNKITINDLGFLIGPILNAGGRLNKSSYSTDLLSSDNIVTVNNRSINLIELNEKRKKIEDLIIAEIDFNKIKNEDENIIVYYNQNINEGLIGIIAARLKDYFNKPSIVITKSNQLLKGSARSVNGYNIGHSIKLLVDKNILINGGGHNMAAGFTLEKKNLDNFRLFLQKDYNKKKDVIFNEFHYDAEISSMAFNKDFFSEIKKIGPFGNENPLPTFIFKDLKIIKRNILNNKHISSIFKSKIGFSINSISFNSVNTKMGEYLLNYKKDLNVIGQINENFWNNKNTLQLTVRDLIL